MLFYLILDIIKDSNNLKEVSLELDWDLKNIGTQVLKEGVIY